MWRSQAPVVVMDQSLIFLSEWKRNHQREIQKAQLITYQSSIPCKEDEIIKTLKAIFQTFIYSTLELFNRLFGNKQKTF